MYQRNRFGHLRRPLRIVARHQALPRVPAMPLRFPLLANLRSYQSPSDDKPAAQGGPRIAKIKFANPESHPQRIVSELSPQ
jgi:hypothetical protein